MRRLNLPFVQLLTTRQSKSTWRASALLVEIQPEVKVKSREKERERRRKRGKTRGVMSPRKPGRETSSRNWSEKLAPSFIVHKAFYTLIKHGVQWVTENYVAFAPQTLSVHHFVYKRSLVIYIIFWPRGLLNTFWLSSLMKDKPAGTPT